MDRIEAMKVFVAALDEGSLAGAGRRLRRSPAAVSRAIAFLERHVGAELLHRTTRTIKLSDAGERYASACRRVLLDLEEADLCAASERSAPRGTLTITAPPISGEEILRPVIDAYLDAYPAVSVNLILLDRYSNLVEEGIDIALRVAELPDSSMVAVRIGGDVKRVIVASPRYLAEHPRIAEPADLLKHRIITTTHFGHDAWIFPPATGSSIARSIHFKPRLVVNSVRAALASAVDGHGVTRLYTYHVAERVQEGSLKIVLRNAENLPLPVHLITPQGRMSVPKVRAFVDFAVPRLRAEFARLSAEADALRT
ncbi:LysR family transcriptional regulator [Bradyrhizobium sp. AUGA SZCCT0176]|uniref:LysR family transcriptional regulator n=1 Tax=unclassified Bradyrhizobium TaxID=2631580 RepID=UPI001BA893B4|nr:MULTISPECIES: LysR family transcriptional regulator [unclassified Bradyrhizobium]MBR1225183.1 LysR family transcriptional regulator [Bradyrhizobium sp. AUGA SZCCT0176]MBR1281272.1 LysR family transcriptional regulator [Bradyrhizobium sp. AUGA SZCCT0177]